MKNIKLVFNVVMLILIALFLISFFNNPEGPQKNIFFYKCKNLSDPGLPLVIKIDKDVK